MVGSQVILNQIANTTTTGGTVVRAALDTTLNGVSPGF